MDNHNIFVHRVLNPPGGRSNNIFGDYSEPVEQKAKKSDAAPISNVFGNAATEEAANSAMKNKAKSQESSQVLLP